MSKLSTRELAIENKLYQDITLLLFIHDPARLCYSDNLLEYEPQSSLIFSKLHTISDVDILAKEIKSIFIQLFSQEVANDFSDYRLLATEIERSYKKAQILKNRGVL